ncbi:MAG TPA: CPBP family intramembrane glutamic endopeptidase [Terriglobales bacterium]|nr:CPBP family intramembrane glutamic endopeptidase [Terriglobales bacterium]
MKLSFGFRQTSGYLLAYTGIYAITLWRLHRVEHFDVSEPLLVLAIVGIGFSGLAWWFTRRVDPLPLTIQGPRRETALLACYLIGIAAFIAWGFNAIELGVASERLRSLVLLASKLVVFVFLPLVLLHQFWGYSFRDFLVISPELRQHWKPALWMSLVMVIFQLVFGRGLSEIRHAGPPAWALIIGIPVCFIWLLIEVGLVEEFFFRALLQSRLSAWLHSEAGGIVLASLLFGLAHAPGLYYRTARTLEAVGPHPSWLMAVGYSIVVISVPGLFMGVLWSRTRNLLLLMTVHAAGDLVPQLAPMIRTWL